MGPREGGQGFRDGSPVSRRVLKWAVPVDDHDHPIGSGPVLHVGMQGSVVMVWTDEHDSERPIPRSARVYGTGQEVPKDDFGVGSVIDGSFVWHVFVSRMPDPQRSPDG